MAEIGNASGWTTAELEKELQLMIQNGCLSDLVEVQPRDLQNPKSIAPWNHLPFKLYQSPTVTRVLTIFLDNIVPGTPATYNQILSAIMRQTHTDSFCYLIGGQVRDILMGKLSKDVDFNYACTAQDVASVCVQNEWPVKYKAIGPVSKPNYVLIGDEQSDLYMEGFSIHFNATSACFKQDFRQNMLFFDIANQVIIDKSGYGLVDIRNCELRLACAPSQDFEDWAGADMAFGQKPLRYVKFIVRSRVRQAPMKTDHGESAFVASVLRRAFQENAESLKGFWFGYVLGECLSTHDGVQTLYEWVCEQGGPSWWEDWLPFVQLHVKDSTWLSLLRPAKITQEADMIKIAFEKIDTDGDGLIDQKDLKRLMLKLGTDFVDEDFDALFARIRPLSPGKLKYNDFVDFLLGFSLP